MREVIDSLLAQEYTDFKQLIENRLRDLVSEKLNQVKLRLVAELYDTEDAIFDYEIEELSEANVQRMGRTKLVRVRIRGGKVQRRKKLSAVSGYTLRGGRMVRMSAQERRHRKMAARRAKFKRRAKMQQTIRKRGRSLRDRKSTRLNSSHTDISRMPSSA